MPACSPSCRMNAPEETVRSAAPIWLGELTPSVDQQPRDLAPQCTLRDQSCRQGDTEIRRLGSRSDRLSLVVRGVDVQHDEPIDCLELLNQQWRGKVEWLCVARPFVRPDGAHSTRHDGSIAQQPDKNVRVCARVLVLSSESSDSALAEAASGPDSTRNIPRRGEPTPWQACRRYPPRTTPHTSSICLALVLGARSPAAAPITWRGTLERCSTPITNPNLASVSPRKRMRHRRGHDDVTLLLADGAPAGVRPGVRSRTRDPAADNTN